MVAMEVAACVGAEGSACRTCLTMRGSRPGSSMHNSMPAALAGEDCFCCFKGLDRLVIAARAALADGEVPEARLERLLIGVVVTLSWAFFDVVTSGIHPARASRTTRGSVARCDSG